MKLMGTLIGSPKVSKFIPYGKVVKEQIAQAVRKSVGLKSGVYVRVKLGLKIGTMLAHRAQDEVLKSAARLAGKIEGPSFKIISEEEFQQRANGTFKEPATDAGTVGPISNVTNFQVGDEVDVSKLPYEAQIALIGQPLADALSVSNNGPHGIYEVMSVDNSKGTIIVGEPKIE